MNIAMVSPYDLGRFGGVQDQCFKLSSWLTEAGHTTTVIGPGVGPEGTVSVGPVTVVPANGAATPISLDRKVGVRLREAVAGADVVHIHEPLMPAVSLAALRIPDIPKVGTFHADASRAVRGAYRTGRPLVRRLLEPLDAIIHGVVIS